MNCEKCRYYDIDYEWDDDYEDEAEICICKKGYYIEVDAIEDCQDFKK